MFERRQWLQAAQYCRHVSPSGRAENFGTRARRLEQRGETDSPDTMQGKVLRMELRTGAKP